MRVEKILVVLIALDHIVGLWGIEVGSLRQTEIDCAGRFPARGDRIGLYVKEGRIEFTELTWR